MSKIIEDKKLVLKTLQEVYDNININPYTVEVVSHEVGIENFTMQELNNYFQEYGIPNEAVLTADDDRMFFVWEEERLKTDEEILKGKITAFKNRWFKAIFDALTAKGYKRVGVNTMVLSEFEEKYGTTNAYELWSLKNNEDVLMEYVSLYFKKKEDDESPKN